MMGLAVEGSLALERGAFFVTSPHWEMVPGVEKN